MKNITTVATAAAFTLLAKSSNARSPKIQRNLQSTTEKFFKKTCPNNPIVNSDDLKTKPSETQTYNNGGTAYYDGDTYANDINLNASTQNQGTIYTGTNGSGACTAVISGGAHIDLGVGTKDHTLLLEDKSVNVDAFGSEDRLYVNVPLNNVSVSNDPANPYGKKISINDNLVATIGLHTSALTDDNEEFKNKYIKSLSNTAVAQPTTSAPVKQPVPQPVAQPTTSAPVKQPVKQPVPQPTGSVAVLGQPSTSAPVPQPIAPAPVAQPEPSSSASRLGQWATAALLATTLAARNALN
jgi:hypothetical protein